ncbi:hypothetical protein FPQ18DRAFT_389422 [Pyronema domesticum]|nr:hypothetical protein FPQ18DRAFT_389422 [Pyronema domesticum]
MTGYPHRQFVIGVCSVAALWIHRHLQQPSKPSIRLPQIHAQPTFTLLTMEANYYNLNTFEAHRAIINTLPHSLPDFETEEDFHRFLLSHVTSGVQVYNKYGQWCVRIYNSPGEF